MCWKGNDRDYIIFIAATVIFMVEYWLISSQKKCGFLFFFLENIFC